MPMFHPTMPNMAFKPFHNANLVAHRVPSATAALTAPAPLPGAISNDVAVASAAPPSVVQMQIKALISEQALTPEAHKQAQSETQ